MFDNLEDIVIHYDEIMAELAGGDVANDQNRFRKLMKEQSDLAPLVETYGEYKKAKQLQEDALPAPAPSRGAADAGSSRPGPSRSATASDGQGGVG